MRQCGNVGASERGRAQGGRESCAKFPQDERFRGRVEIAVAPQRANDPCPLVGPPGRFRRARGGDHSRARLRRLTGEIRGNRCRRLGIAEQFRFAPAPNPPSVRLSGMGFGKRGQRWD